MLQDWVKKEFAPADELEIQRQENLLEEMGITTDDASYLRKQQLSASEAVAAKKEELGNIRTHKGRKSNWLEYMDVKARMGFVLHGNDVIRRLRTILPQVLPYEGRVRGTLGLACPLLRHYEDKFRWGWEYLGWIHKESNPEYEIDLIDEDGVPLGRRQGYRTFLLNLITRRDGTGNFMLKGNGIVRDGTGLPLNIVTEGQVLDAFGYPTNGLTASNYRKQLYEFRNGRKTNPIAWT